MFTPLLFRCQACGLSVTRETLPLCPTCSASLVRCPDLCGSCFAPGCPKTGPCARPWVRIPELDSLNALYLGVGIGYSVLKRWKRCGGPTFDRRVLKRDPALASRLRALEVGGVVAVPQLWERAWRLGGSPAERVAIAAAGWAGAPLLRCLEPGPEGLRRQAELPLPLRFANRLRFEPTLGARPPESILLVDDFVTTTRTLRVAAAVLRERLGVLRVHGFCLAVRPRLNLGESDAGAAGRNRADGLLKGA